MIPAKELRLENWVLRQFWNPHPETPGFMYDECKVEIVKPETVNLRLKDNSILSKYPIKDLYPVELTPGLLKECGFKDEAGPMVNYPLYAFEWDNNPGKLEIVIGKPWDGMFTKIKYLHQLQNLFFALTGEELPYCNSWFARLKDKQEQKLKRLTDGL